MNLGGHDSPHGTLGLVSAENLLVYDYAVPVVSIGERVTDVNAESSHFIFLFV